MVLRGRPWLVIGQWAGGAWPRARASLSPVPSAPQSGAPGKVSASARDSPWPLPPARAAELGPPDGCSPGSRTPDAGRCRGAGPGQTPDPRAHGRTASPQLRGTLSPGGSESPRLPRASGTLALAPDGSGGWGPGAGRVPTGTPGFPGLPSPRPPRPGLGSPVWAPVCARVSARGRGASEAVSPRVSAAPRPGQGRRWGLPTRSPFSSETSKTKKTFKPVWGEIGCPTD